MIRGRAAHRLRSGITAWSRCSRHPVIATTTVRVDAATMRWPSRTSRLAATGVVAFVLNAAWERAHWHLYQPPFTLSRWLRASAGDALFISIADLALVADPTPRRRGRFCAALAFLAVLIELDAVHRDRWRYRPGMPTVATVGLTPLAQLPVTGLAALGVVNLLHRTHCGTASARSTTTALLRPWDPLLRGRQHAGAEAAGPPASRTARATSSRGFWLMSTW